MSWLDYSIYEQSLLDWAVALAITLMLAVVFHYVHRIVINRLRRYASRTITRLDDVAIEILAGTHFLFLLILAIYLGAQYLDLAERAANAISRALVVALLVQAAVWGTRAIACGLTYFLQTRRGADAAGATTMSLLGFIARVVLWSIVALMILDNLGVNITALVASIGIGGIAMALAVQNILGDIFASLSITLDKPFVIGDFIVVDDIMGTIEHIGIKTTHIRSLSGELILFSNADLLKSRIRNHKRMVERRVLFSFGVVYETAPEALERIPQMIREIIEAQPKTRFDRAHFKDYGEFALNFETVYFVRDSEYNVYMDIQQAINLELFRRLQQEGIAFAYPTRTLRMRTEPAAASAETAKEPD